MEIQGIDVVTELATLGAVQVIPQQFATSLKVAVEDQATKEGSETGTPPLAAVSQESEPQLNLPLPSAEAEAEEKNAMEPVQQLAESAMVLNRDLGLSKELANQARPTVNPDTPERTVVEPMGKGLNLQGVQTTDPILSDHRGLISIEGQLGRVNQKQTHGLVSLVEVADGSQLPKVIQGAGEVKALAISETQSVALNSLSQPSPLDVVEGTAEAQPLLAVGALRPQLAGQTVEGLEPVAVLKVEATEHGPTPTTSPDFEPPKSLYDGQPVPTNALERLSELLQGESEPGPVADISQLKRTEAGVTMVEGDQAISGFQRAVIQPQVPITKEAVPPSAVQGTAPATPEMVKTFQQQNVTRITELLSQPGKTGQDVMKLTLQPESLGQLEILVTFEEGQISAKFLVGNEQVKEMFEKSLPLLEQHLAKQQIVVNKVDVALQTTSQGSFDSQSQFDQQHNQQQRAKATRQSGHYQAQKQVEVVEAVADRVDILV